MEAEVLPRDDEEQADRARCRGRPATRWYEPSSADRRQARGRRRPSGWRIRRQTTPVMTSDEDVRGEEDQCAGSRGPRNRRLSSSARPSANGIWSDQRQDDDDDVVADRAAEHRVGQRTLEVVEPDEVGRAARARSSRTGCSGRSGRSGRGRTATYSASAGQQEQRRSSATAPGRAAARCAARGADGQSSRGSLRSSR